MLIKHGIFNKISICWRHAICFIFLFSLVLSLLSCATYQIRREVAAAVDLPGVKTIAVLPFSCRTNRDFGWVLADKMAMNIANKGHFQVVERSQIDRVLGELGFQQSGLFDDASAARIGKFCGAEAVVTGNVSVYECRDSSWTAQDQNGNSYPVYEREVNCSADCKIILVESGILKYGGTFGSKEKSPNSRDRSSLKSCLILSEASAISIANQLYRMISPHYEIVRVDIDLGAQDVKIAMKNGVDFLNNNFQDRAEANFLEVSRMYPNASAPIYNLGIVALMNNDYDKAIRLINRAIDLLPRSREEKTTTASMQKYLNGLKKAEEGKANQGKLARQKQLAGHTQAPPRVKDSSKSWNDDPSSLVVIVDTANIRENANTNCAIVGKVFRGESLILIDQMENWYYIQTQNGTEGWIHQNLVR